MNLKQQKTLALLKEFIAIMEEHNLQYSLIYGTMLGAIRHNGFIPWDDDVDVVVPKSTYDFLVQNYPDVFLHNKNSNNFLLFGKFTHDLETNEDAIFIDVFVAVQTSAKLIKKYTSLNNRIRYLKNYTHRPLFKRQWGMKILKFVCLWTWLAKKITLEEAYTKLHDPNGDISLIITWPFKSEIRKSSYQCIDFNSVFKHDFEDIQANVFTNYESMLIQTYGNNWNIPKKFVLSTHLGMYDIDVFTFKKKVKDEK
ncbi:diacylglycerol cholinephosphotransferase Mf1 [Mycoplasma simbae]|uniref:diacylglycerol cholinephosphotransferase Mf1 n=1 Tax=Mycoplasma simbae TaxID=36744 RepID=UPI000496D5C3|nr:LicD family protein [Mycoplasma simbae]